MEKFLMILISFVFNILDKYPLEMDLWMMSSSHEPRLQG